MADSSRPNIAVGLRLIHAVITRGLGVAEGRGGLSPTDGPLESARARGFADYVATLANALDAHHSTEEEIAFPYFRGLMPDMPFDSLSQEHQLMVPLAHRLIALAGQVRESAGSGDITGALDDIHRTAVELIAIWGPHIATEERYWTAERLDQLLPPEEHVRLMGLFSEHMKRDAQPDALAVPFLLFNLPAEERGVFTAGMPEVGTQQWIPGDWKEQWLPMAPFLLEP